MSKLQRIQNTLAGIVMLVCAAFLMLHPDASVALWLMCALIALTLLVYGFKQLFFYMGMARHMVGGKALLYVGIIALDASVLLSLSAHAQFFVALYLAATSAISGGLSVFKSVEAKNLGSPWKLDMAMGIGNLLLAVACVALSGSSDVLVTVYSIGLVYGAGTRIAAAFQQHDIVYIS